MPDVVLPTPHPGQLAAFKFLRPNRFSALRCGRRWGKTKMLSTIGCDRAIRGLKVGIFAPAYKITAETFNEVAELLHPIKAASSKVDGLFRTTTGGRLDYWTLEDERAGRSRSYDLAIIDEAAFAKPNMMDIWNKAIKPTLLDRAGRAFVASTPSGIDPDNFFWRICNEPEHGFVEFQAPTHSNPLLPAEELARLQAENPPLVYQQEYLAEFVDWSGQAFFVLENCLVNGQPVEFPTICDGVFATIDTASKTGKEHDGTAVSYWARSRNIGHPLVLLDWDIVQIEGATLEVWLPGVFRRLEELGRQVKALRGSLGAFIEDKNSGTILLQQARQHGWPAMEIDSRMTSLGKDERAINASSYVHRQMVKISRFAYEKTVPYKGQTRNHMLQQVFTFRIGDKDPLRADDLTDTWSYGISLGLGGSEGF